MKLHENNQLFRQSVQFTAQQMSLPEVYIEKDYWVTYALREIFRSDIGKDTVFKGGTALLKCYNLIGRFSEDIDLVVFRREKESNNRLSEKLKAIGKIVSERLPEVIVEGITQKMGMNRKTAHSYAKTFTGNYGQVRDVVIVEATWLGYFEPHETKQISSFIHDMMERTNQAALIVQYELQPFDALVLHPQRTICEKIMSLVRFSYEADPIEALQKKIRHLYDLNKLLQDNLLSDFFYSNDFETMLSKVGSDDVISYKNNNDWLKYHPKDALLFAESDNVWEKLKPVYQGDFMNLVFDQAPPSSDEIFKTILEIRQRLFSIEWNVGK